MKLTSQNNYNGWTVKVKLKYKYLWRQANNLVSSNEIDSSTMSYIICIGRFKIFCNQKFWYYYTLCTIRFTCYSKITNNATFSTIDFYNYLISYQFNSNSFSEYVFTSTFIKLISLLLSLILDFIILEKIISTISHYQTTYLNISFLFILTCFQQRYMLSFVFTVLII